MYWLVLARSTPLPSHRQKSHCAFSGWQPVHKPQSQVSGWEPQWLRFTSTPRTPGARENGLLRGSRMGLWWDYHGIIVGLSWDYHGITVGPRDCNGIIVYICLYHEQHNMVHMVNINKTSRKLPSTSLFDALVAASNPVGPLLVKRQPHMASLRRLRLPHPSQLQ